MTRSVINDERKTLWQDNGTFPFLLFTYLLCYKMFLRSLLFVEKTRYDIYRKYLRERGTREYERERKGG